MTRAFSHTGRLKPGKTVFDLSYEVKTTCDMGYLIPMFREMCNPGSHYKFGNQIIVRFTPLVAPVLHEVNVAVHYFFVPYRILDQNWEDFISGGADGQNDYALPRWNPTNYAPGSLWDYFGFPTNLSVSPTNGVANSLPLAYLKRAYNLIWNEFYRDENLQAKVDINQDILLKRNWEKDYFTSSLPFQQRGIAPALPVSGTTFAQFLGGIQKGLKGGTADFTDANYIRFNNSNPAATAITIPQYTDYQTTVPEIQRWFNNNVVDFSHAATFDVSDLRLAFQLQKWQERNARGGVRYTELLRSHFGVSPRDDRLQRPEYCGGSKSPIIFSEVLQTSESGSTPQANMAGHGISVQDSYCGNYFAQEFGILIGLMSVMPRTNYQQGINRKFSQVTRFDFYWPEFSNLSEMAIKNREIFFSPNDEPWNDDIFGFQAIYDEYRYNPNLTTGHMRSGASGYSYDYWTLSRYFESRPFLNSDFVTCNPSKRIFAVQDEHGLIVSFANLVKGVLPMPIISEPGLIDHH